MDVVRPIAKTIHEILIRDPRWRWESCIEYVRDGDVLECHYTLYSNTSAVVKITEGRGYRPDAPKRYRVSAPEFPRRCVIGFCDVRTTVSNVKAVLDGCYTPTCVDAIAAEVRRWTRDDMRWLQWN